MKNKNVIRENLLKVYDTYGLKVAVQAAAKTLTIVDTDADFKMQYNGEICETVLEINLMSLIANKHYDWFYTKSLVLPDVESGNTKFLTEIDFVLFTPQCVFCIECKSYAGDKCIVDKGTIVLENGNKRDVYQQNKMHLDTLQKLINPFSKVPKYQMLLFNFARGDVHDKRDTASRHEFPIVTCKTVEDTLWRYTRGDAVWDMKGLHIAKGHLEEFSDKHRAAQLAYVKSLHSKE